MASIALAFCAACALSLALVPIIKQLCFRLDLTDRPDSHRKLHRRPIALGGGIAVFLATFLTVLGLTWFRSDAWAWMVPTGSSLIGLLIAATIILIVGVVDDALGLRGRHKLLGQFVACVVLSQCGLQIHRLQFFGWVVDLGLLSTPVTVIWLLAAINAINLLDGINGLATTVGIIDSLSIAVLAAYGGHRSQAFVAAAFAGGLLGFLRYNFPHAKMFLGDAGSMLIGLVVGGLAVETSLKGPGTVLFATPLCLMTIPLFDSAAAMVRRKLTGRSIFSGDRAHLQHRLSERFGSARAVGIVALSCGATGVAALASMIWRNGELVAVVSGGAVIVMFVVSRMFGHAELRLLASRMHSLVRSYFRLNGSRRTVGTQSTVHLQGRLDWELVWSDLKEAAVDLPINAIELCVNAPMIQEGFHAAWNRRPAEFEGMWRFEFPLLAAGHRIGHLRVSGERSLHVPAGSFDKTLLLFESVESQLESLFIGPAPDHRPADHDLTGAALITEGSKMRAATNV